MPRTQSVTPARAHQSAKPPHLPGLNGRSVRRLRELRALRSLRSVLVAAVSAGALLVAASVAVPAYAEATAAPPPPPLQVLSVSPTAIVAAVERDGYSVTAPPPVQWPTAAHSGISSSFGPRAAPCSGCSSYHQGVDFDAGYGTEVRAMAAGVVVERNDPFLGALGNHVTIQHEIDGQVLTTVYGHMQYGYTSLSVGDTVKVGQVIGLVGSTGASTGPHLHFEIRIGGSAINPLPWLYAHIG